MSVGTKLKKLLRTTPRKFQIRGVRFAENAMGRSLNADQMGLGKSMQTISWFLIHPEVTPVIILCPATMKYIWQEEIYKHAGLNSHVASGRTPYYISAEIIIFNYDIVAFWEKAIIEKIQPKLMVLDECHYCKNRSAKRTKSCIKIGKKTRHILPLSGTPITNRPVEFFPVLNLIAPQEFSSFWKFAMRYCDPKPGWGGHGWNFTGASHLEELHEKLKPYMIRRTKNNVLKELPAKQYTTIPMDIDNAAEYKKASTHFLKWLATKKGKEGAAKAANAEAIVKLGQLKQVAAMGKMKQAVKWIEDFLDDSNEKIVIFAHHKKIISILNSHFPFAAVIDGSVSMANRNIAIKNFQTNPNCRVFIGNMKAAGVGITLTASSTVVFLELGWTPADHEQAEDRIHRIGQKADSVNIYYLIAKNTVEEKIVKVLETKRKIVAQVIDGEELTEDVINIVDAVSMDMIDNQKG